MATETKPVPVENAVRFMEAYNRLDQFLKELTDDQSEKGFSVRVKLAQKKNAAVRRYLGSLLAFAQLRNVIAHENPFPIAVPKSEVVEDLEHIVEEICAPPTACQKYKANILCFRPEDQLQQALQYMKEKDYSQVVVRDQGRLRLLTSEGITGWLRASIGDDLVSLQEIRLRDVIEHEPKGTLAFAARDDSIYEVQDKFASSGGGSRLFAVIITDHGRDTEAPLGIATPWDN